MVWAIDFSLAHLTENFEAALGTSTKAHLVQAVILNQVSIRYPG
jgi:hypothetical protein